LGLMVYSCLVAKGQEGMNRHSFIHRCKFSIIDSSNSAHVLDSNLLYLKPYTFYKGYAFFEFHRHHRCWFNCDLRVLESQAEAMDNKGNFLIITTMNDSIYKASGMNWEPPISYSHLPGKWHFNKRKQLLRITLLKNSNYFPAGDSTIIFHYEGTRNKELLFSKKGD
jgi:hypothetical protein